MAINTKAYIEHFIKIRDKRGEVIPMKLNLPQMKLYAALKQQHEQGKPLRAIVLKARQMGFSTLTEAMMFKRTVTGTGVKSGIVAHTEDASANLYRMAKLMYTELPAGIRPEQKLGNAKELVFAAKGKGGLDSTIRVMTAGGSGIGRSDTFQNLHLSEFAFWPGDKRVTLAGAMQAVPDMPGTMVIIESTANGFDEFKTMWDRAVAGESEFVPVFCAWWELDEYRRAYTGFSLTDYERELMRRYGLDHEQLAWRRWCIENNCGGDVQLFRQEYPACPEEAFLSTGSCIFDKDAVMRRLNEGTAPLYRANLNYRLVMEQANQRLVFDGVETDDRGGVWVYEEPQDGVPYVIGADTAGDGSDWFVAQVVNNLTGKQAAVLRRKYDEDAFACEAMALGYWYNTALLGIEANFSTYPIKTVERLCYPHQFMREQEDSYTHRPQKKWGFRTTMQTRPIILAELVRLVREQPELICDAQTLREMLVFVKNERGRPEAMQGEHDDCVMALAIAHYIRPQQRSWMDNESGGYSAWEPCDDYANQMNDFMSFGG